MERFDHYRMKLNELLQYENIVIQCHDNPDADAIGSGFGLYVYFHSKGKQVTFIYSGKNLIAKSNLVLMVEELHIPITYLAPGSELPAGCDLLLMTDCQYGEGNVTKFEAPTVAVIDHHQVARELPALNDVRSGMGSCSTIVWDLLKKEHFPVEEDKALMTALYYGLYMDTTSLTEVTHPLDRDLRDLAQYDKALMNRLRNANITLQELKIAGVALLGYEYYEEYRYAIMHADPCDPNILGLISDFALTVDSVDVVVIYSILPFGLKYSVRSCVKEVEANDLAAYLAAGVGSGGGHKMKAGGLIQYDLLEKPVATARTRDYKAVDLLRDRMDAYFRSSDCLDTEKDKLDLSDFQLYEKAGITEGYLKADDLFRLGEEVQIRMVTGDITLKVQPETYFIINVEGEVHPVMADTFHKNYIPGNDAYAIEPEYPPTVKSLITGEVRDMLECARTCTTSRHTQVYARKLTRNMKLFTRWDEEGYMHGKPGDYLVARKDDPSDYYVVSGTLFDKYYEKL